MFSLEEVKKIVLRPYLTQAKSPLVAVKTSSDAVAFSKTIFKFVPVALPLKNYYQKFIYLRKFIAKWYAELEFHKEIITITPPVTPLWDHQSDQHRRLNHGEITLRGS